MTGRLEVATLFGQSVAASQCLQLGAIHDAVLLARRNPEVYVSAGACRSRREQIRFAERSVVFDLALRLSIAEGRVWGQFYDADALITRLPKLWTDARGGQIAYANLQTAARTAASLPDPDGLDDAGLFDRLDEALRGKAPPSVSAILPVRSARWPSCAPTPRVTCLPVSAPPGR